MSDYLWDKSGAPDPEIERLERSLQPLAHQPRALAPLPSLPRRRPARRVWIPAALAAAAMAVIVLLAWKPWRPHAHGAPIVVAPSGPSWAASIAGATATCDGRSIAGETRLPVGAWLETGSSRATLRVADLGTVTVAPNTRARIVAIGAQQKMELDRGVLDVAIDAPPRTFLVATRHALVTDLGCAFELAVDDAGKGRLLVRGGKVALSDGTAREVVVPAGAECALTSGGPGTPYFSDASAAFRAALARYAASSSSPAALAALLKEARAKDGLTLRQLAADADDTTRPLLLERAGQLDAGDAPAMKPRPIKKRAAKLEKKPKIAPSSPARKTEPPHKSAAPAHKTIGPEKLDHDALKGLERSIP